MMRVRSSAAEVGHFLHEFKTLLGSGDGPDFDLWLTDKNQRFLDAGFTKADVALVIRSLRVEDYSWGPEPDEDDNRPQGDVWLFWAEFEGWELYVKLKIERGQGKSPVLAVCMSCHEPAFPIHRPYRSRGRGR